MCVIFFISFSNWIHFDEDLRRCKNNSNIYVGLTVITFPCELIWKKWSHPSRYSSSPYIVAFRSSLYWEFFGPHFCTLKFLIDTTSRKMSDSLLWSFYRLLIFEKNFKKFKILPPYRLWDLEKFRPIPYAMGVKKNSELSPKLWHLGLGKIPKFMKMLQLLGRFQEQIHWRSGKFFPKNVPKVIEKWFKIEIFFKRSYIVETYLNIITHKILRKSGE